MIDYTMMPKRQILCVDMRSFYASCTAVEKGQDPLTSRIAIVGDENQKGSVILAASPRLKKEFGIRTGSRLHELPSDRRIQLLEPNMAQYLRISTEITKLFHRYVPKESIHIYSVDESFLQVDGTSALWGDAWEVAKHIADDMMREFGLPCAIGIGPNMLIAKLCLDIDAKRNGIAEWKYTDIEKKLWPITPLSAMWGIGRRMEVRLNKMGIFSVGDLANDSLERLEKEFGIMGNQLYYHAHGVDLSEIGAPIMEGQISFGRSQILLRDYTAIGEIESVVLEMCEEVARRTRKHHLAARTLHLGIGYSRLATVSSFHRSRSLSEPTAITMELYRLCLALLHENLEPQPVRKISISLTNLVPDHSLQMDLFNPKRNLAHKLGYTMDAVRERYGSASLLRAVSYTEAGTSRRRATLIGGHKSTKIKKEG
ncbi:DNA polymerase thumb domain-containing protein [Jeotgalibacillus proteolyticus]|uniref:UV damage repair protein UvrX n=1 Tax=Jeotgalibacillus proteolyticus TaxID=2082395 RepID=A0A2S5GEC0_9BACL|nr:UV damage repair protein UvrX [Jeotgalibacillus proteolyticus]PPA71329.1 UV damage repair protein UvrX [Jeotgalibacillus proteolyticus]